MTRAREHGVLRLWALLLLFALFCCPQTLAADAAQAISLNARIELELSEQGETFLFSVPSNSSYNFMSFGGAGARAELREGINGQAIALETGFHFTQRLVAAREYALTIYGEGGHAGIEIMRDALGRSFERPLVLQNLSQGYTKAVARAGDVHWYRFTADHSGPYMIATRGEIATDGIVMDDMGMPLSGTEIRTSPYDKNFALQLNLVKNQTYYLRVSALDDEVGRYTLRFIRGTEDEPMPQNIILSETSISLQMGERAQLSATLQPEHAMAELLWVSTDTTVATVRATGQVQTVAPGSCEIIALGFGQAQATCKVTVSTADLSAVEFKQPMLRLSIGEQSKLSIAPVPEGAAMVGVSLVSEDTGIATVDDAGTVKAVAVGKVNIKAVDGAGKVLGQMELSVTEPPAKRRALILGEQKYLDGRVRLGSVNTTMGMADLFRNQSFDGATYEVTMRMDSGRTNAIAAIRNTFKDARAGDISLFAINCHGGYENGTPYLEFYDGSRLTAQGLEAELRKVPGTVVVIIDCCNSGAFISRMERSQFTSRMMEAFGTDRSGSFGMSKYRVICSSGPAQESYRISPEGIQSEAYMSTALARALCMAGGWELVEDRRMSMKADADKNGIVTLEEAYQYAYRRVKTYLRDAADLQDVQIYPRGAQFALFSRIE